MKFYAHINLSFLVMFIGFLNGALPNKDDVQMKKVYEKYEAVRNELNNIVGFQNIPVIDSEKWAKKIDVLIKEFDDFSDDIEEFKKMNKASLADELIKRADILKAKMHELSNSMKKQIVELPRMPWE